MTYLIAILFVLAIILVVILYDAMAWGWVFLKFYGWFVLPVMGFLPVITYWQAIGLMLFVSLFKNATSMVQLKEEYYENGKTERTIIGLLTPWLVLFFGWLVKAILL